MRQAKRVAHRLDVGSVNVNDAISHYPVSLLPFGGVKQSGNARTHGKEEILQFTQLRSYAIGRPPVPIDLATRMREPDHYKLGAAILRLSFGVTPQQRLQPLKEALDDAEKKPKVGKMMRVAGVATAVAALAVSLFRAKNKPQM